MDDTVSLRSNDDDKDDALCGALDWKRAHAELVILARTQARLDTQIGRWLLYARRAVTHAWLGYASLTQYARQLFGFTPRQTQERLRVAEALEELPALGLALEEGKLCWSAVRELTRVATPETESDWLAAAALLLMARCVLGGPIDEGRSSYQVAISMCPSCERAFQNARGDAVRP